MGVVYEFPRRFYSTFFIYMCLAYLLSPPYMVSCIHKVIGYSISVFKGIWED
jgi:hypothetical protein